MTEEKMREALAEAEQIAWDEAERQLALYDAGTQTYGHHAAEFIAKAIAALSTKQEAGEVSRSQTAAPFDHNQQECLAMTTTDAFTKAREWALDALDGKPDAGTVEMFVDLAMLRVLADAFETVEGANAAGVKSGTLANGDTFGDEDDQ